MESSLYERDFYAWTLEQCKLLKVGDFERLDIVNLVEEIESLGKQQRRELEHRLGILVGHLLKWDYQPEKRSKSWWATIREQRRAAQRLIDQHPSLKAYLGEAMIEAHESGLDLVVKETPLNYRDLPAEPIYTLEQLLDPNFPDALD
ncbi:MAG: DUF29 domain-containing protein [Spirulina sp. DLM2.Bin59]|nr:MAG: DUF29 domain-containing protein [Spirulina sp. DLM2.Bin59]